MKPTKTNIDRVMIQAKNYSAKIHPDHVINLAHLVILAKDWFDAIADTVTPGSPASDFIELYRDVIDEEI